MQLSLESIQNEIEELAVIAGLLKNQGWKSLKKHIDEIRKCTQDKLVKASSYQDIRRLQERYLAYTEVLDYPIMISKLLEQRRMELEKLQEENKTREQYGI